MTAPTNNPVTNPSKKPTKAELAAAANLTVSDLIAPNLRVLFCGINPGLYTAAVGHHFGRPGNKFWPSLHGAGFTPRLFLPSDEQALLPLGYGITNLVRRTTATAAELSPDEFTAGAVRLRATLSEYSPRVVAFLGMGAYRSAFARPKATLGLQPEREGNTALWLLPSPSGLNANHQLADIIVLLEELRAWADAPSALPAFAAATRNE